MRQYARGLYFIVISLLHFGCSCNRDDNGVRDIQNKDGVYTSKKYLWHTPLGAEWIGSFIYSPIVYDGKVLMAKDEKETDYIAFVDIETGKIEDKLKHPYYNTDFRIVKTYQKGAMLVVLSPQFYRLDLKTKKVVWKLDKKDRIGSWSHAEAVGIDDKFFVPVDDDDVDRHYDLYEVDINTGSYKKVFTTVVNATDAKDIEEKFPREIKPIKNAKGDLLIVVLYEHYYKREAKKGSQSLLSLYNYTQKHWVYENIPFTEKGGLTFGTGIQVYKDKVYLMTKSSIACHRLSTGKQIWRRYYEQGAWNAGIIVNGKLVVPMGNDYTMCINVEVDYFDVLWSTNEGDGGNNVGKLYELNGIVYFASRGDKRIHAIEINTGKYLWHIGSPDYSFDSGAFFKPEIWVIPGKNGKKGRIITSTYRSGICYEAIR